MSHFEGDVMSPRMRLYLHATQLKNVLRKGWLLRGVPRDRCESDGDHVFGGMVLLIECMDHKLPLHLQMKMVRMWIAHELGETGPQGDITPADGVSSEEKRRMEHEAFMEILRGNSEAIELYDLWREFEEGKTESARFVRQVDKLEAVLQAMVEHRRHGVDATEFLDRADHEIVHPRLRFLFDEARLHVQAYRSRP